MKIRMLTILEVCEILRWCETKFYERRSTGLFPMPVNLSGSKKSNLYFEHEINVYIMRSIHIKNDDEFRMLAAEIESNRYQLAV